MQTEDPEFHPSMVCPGSELVANENRALIAVSANYLLPLCFQKWDSIMPKSVLNYAFLFDDFLCSWWYSGEEVAVSEILKFVVLALDGLVYLNITKAFYSYFNMNAGFLSFQIKI